MTWEDLRLLVSALVISRLDYCNSILYSLPKHELDKLPRIHNTAARLITGTKRYEHINPGWEIYTGYLYFHDYPSFCPAYLLSLLQQYHPKPTLILCERAFSVSTPILWNSLPDSTKNTTSLSSFKTGFKTFLFRNFIFDLFQEELYLPYISPN